MFDKNEVYIWIKLIYIVWIKNNFLCICIIYVCKLIRNFIIYVCKGRLIVWLGIVVC